jgi:hypothetical protein
MGVVVNPEVWGRGFLRFTDSVRESSIASEPCAWVGEELVDFVGLRELADSGDPGAQAYVMWACCQPNPRWFEVEKMDHVIEDDEGSMVKWISKYGVITHIKDSFGEWSWSFEQGVDQ